MALPLARGFAALAIRNYRLYWTGQIISRVGTWMQQVSLPWLVLALGGSPIQLGIVAALEFLPSLVLAPFGGGYADRLDQREPRRTAFESDGQREGRQSAS